MKKLWLTFVLLLFLQQSDFLFAKSDYFPLTGGTNWTYTRYDEYTKRVDTMVVDVIGSKWFGNEEYAIFRSTTTQPGPNPYCVSYQYFRKEGNTVFAYEKDTVQIIYKFDLDSGATWKYFPGRNDIDNRNFTIQKKGYSTTINGSDYQNCIKIFSNSDYGTDTEIIEEFTLEAGLIRRSVPLDGIWELISFHLATDVEENTQQSSVLSIFPNPASDYITVTVGANGCSPESIKIFDVFGREEHPPTPSYEEGELRVDVSALPPGVYFVRVGSNVSKFVRVDK